MKEISSHKSLTEAGFCRKSILNNYIEMWDNLSITGKVCCLHHENYLIVHSDVEDPGFNILIPTGKITVDNFKTIKSYYKTKRKDFTIMSSVDYLTEVKEELSPFLVNKMYGLARKTCSSIIFKNALSNELSYIEIFKNSIITQDWKTILQASFSMSNAASQQFLDILYFFTKESNNFNHTITYINDHAASICSILYSKDLIHAGLYNGAGLGKHYSYHKPFVSIVNKQINEAFNKGYKWVVSQSTPAATNALTKYLEFKIMDIYSYYRVLF